MKTKTNPLALFDDLEHIATSKPASVIGKRKIQDYEQAIVFLKAYKGSLGTFNAYRREIEKLFQWAWNIKNKTIKDLKREDIESFVHFCQKPPAAWIGLKKSPRFIWKDGLRVPNFEWKPFVATVSKVAYRKGEKPDVKNFKLSISSTNDIFAVLSTFFNYLLQEEYVLTNPVALIRQKSKFIRKHQGLPKIRRLSELQWEYVIKTAKKMAEVDPKLHERTLFIMTALYAMYLRISELASSKRWTPMMNHFHRDSDGNWWFTTVGKGNKQRQIAVSDPMLNALKRWRKHLNLSPLPSPADVNFLLLKTKGTGPISSTTYIRDIVQNCFNRAIEKLNKGGFTEEADSLGEATVHWLRHTGISDDVKRRPREHVRDDAGHGSSAITDKYIDIHCKPGYMQKRQWVFKCHLTGSNANKEYPQIHLISH